MCIRDSFQIAGIVFLPVCGVQGKHQRVARGFLHLPDFAVEALPASDVYKRQV